MFLKSFLGLKRRIGKKVLHLTRPWSLHPVGRHKDPVSSQRVPTHMLVLSGIKHRHPSFLQRSCIKSQFQGLFIILTRSQAFAVYWESLMENYTKYILYCCMQNIKFAIKKCNSRNVWYLNMITQSAFTGSSFQEWKCGRCRSNENQCVNPKFQVMNAKQEWNTSV